MKVRLTDKKIYLVAILTLASLIALNQFVIQHLIHQIRDDARVINMAGKQRMLSQRIVKNVYHSFEHEEFLQIAKADAKLFNKVHYGLQDGDEELDLPGNCSSVISGLFDEASQYHATLFTLVDEATSPDELREHVIEIDIAEQEFLTLMDRVVSRYEQESNQKVYNLVIIEVVLGILSLLILAFEFKYIFNPIIKEIKMKAVQLERMNVSKDRILAAVAHDMRSPLTAVYGTVNIIRSTHIGLSDDHQMLLRYAEESCEKMEKMIKELLEVNYLESDEYKLDREYVPVENLFQKVKNPIEEAAHEKDINFEMEVLPNSLSVAINMDGFQRVLENLLSNAIKFTNRRGTVKLRSFEREQDVIIQVADNGIGIPNDMHHHIFDKFTKARREGTEGEQTTGLGMSIVKGIVEKHEGKIWFESEEGEGTSFYISLPKAA